MKCLQTVALFLTLALLLAIPVRAQDGPSTTLGTGYDLDWWTVDGGGDGTGGSETRPYTLAGTIGQPDAATWAVQGGSPTPYTLSGGFWLTGPAVAGYEVFLPVVIRSSGP